MTREAILSLYKAEEKEIEKTFANTQVAAVLENFPVYRTKVDIVGFGLKKDEVLYRLARVGKRQTAGVEALTGFWLGKKMEIKNVRIILQALARGLPQEEIQKLLRPTYPGYQA